MRWLALAVLVGVLKHLGVMGLVLAPIYAARRFKRTARRGGDARPESDARAQQ